MKIEAQRKDPGQERTCTRNAYMSTHYHPNLGYFVRYQTTAEKFSRIIRDKGELPLVLKLGSVEYDRNRL